MRRKPLFPTVLLLLSLLFLLVANPPANATEMVSQSGIFSIIWGDSLSGGTVPPERYFLTSADGTTTELLIDSSVAKNAGGTLNLNGMSVTVSVSADSVSADFSGQQNADPAPLLVEHITLHEAIYDMAVTPQAVSGPQPWVTIMCKFQDIGNEPKNLSYFQNMYSASYPGLNHYWQEASYNIVNINGSTATGWYTLPQPRSYYVYDQNSDGHADLDFTRITTDCAAVADSAVYFPGYVGINMMFNSDLDGYAWGGSRYINIDGQNKFYRVTWEPPWGYTDITVMAHEMGHGFGMPHSSGNYGATYDNVWDVMSNAWSNCSAANHPTYGCLGQQTISYHRDLVGWLNTNKKFTFNGTQQTITLERLTQPTTSDYLLAKIPIDGSTTHYYTVEARKKIGYDSKLASEAVIIHEVNQFRSRPAYVIDIDGNGNTSDSGAQWTVGETFTDAGNDVCVQITGQTATGYTVKIGCTPPPQPPPSVPSFSPAVTPINSLLLR